MEWRKAVCRFLRCRNGSSFIEFGLVAPAIFLGIAGIIDFMMVMFVTSLVEGGLQDASRLGRTGYQPSGLSREAAIRQSIADATIGLVDMTEVQITYTVYPGFDVVGQPEPYDDTAPANGAYDAGEPFNDINGNGVWDADMGVSGLGEPGDVVLYQVSYAWTPLTPLIVPFFGPTGKAPISASVAVRNEPWGSPPPPVAGS